VLKILRFGECNNTLHESSAATVFEENSDIWVEQF